MQVVKSFKQRHRYLAGKASTTGKSHCAAMLDQLENILRADKIGFVQYPPLRRVN